jgi:predicted Fe-S protein YdhL (DUF1289 family)
MTPTNRLPEGMGPVPSPCNSICTIDQVSGFCAGCFRTLDEVAAWSVLDDCQKRVVWAALPGRRAAGEPRHGAEGAPRTGTDGQR